MKSSEYLGHGQASSPVALDLISVGLEINPLSRHFACSYHAHACCLSSNDDGAFMCQLAGNWHGNGAAP